MVKRKENFREKKLEILRVEESYELVKELLKPDLGPMYVTPMILMSGWIF